MEAEIRVSGGHGDGIDEIGEFGALTEWLRGERGLAGTIREVQRPPRPGELGGVVEVLVVALGSSGVAGTLATSLFGWLRARLPRLKVTVTRESHSVTLETGGKLDDGALQLLREVLGVKDEP